MGVVWSNSRIFPVLNCILMGCPYEPGRWVTSTLSQDVVIRKVAAQRLAPQLGSNSERIDFAFLPPPPFIACRVIFAVVDGAQRHGEFVAHFERNTLRLRIANMMRMGWGAAADQAWLAATKRRCSFERTRFGSGMARTLLSTFGREPFWV